MVLVLIFNLVFYEIWQVIMVRSMTGFGRCLVEDTHVTQQWEVRSVNGRHLDIRWHLPPTVRSAQARLEKLVRAHAQRGRLDITLILNYNADAQRNVMFDASQAHAMLDTLVDFAHNRQENFDVNYNTLLSISSLWGDNGDVVEEHLVTRLEEGLSVALEDWNEARYTEGKALQHDLNARILRMEQWMHIVEDRVPDIKATRINTVRERVSEILSAQDIELDEQRFLQEIVILADKVDVTEESIRLRTHLQRLNELLHTGKDIGRKLDFTLQECFREINTCGNKIPDVQLSSLVVDFKAELEKCREQVQNIE